MKMSVVVLVLALTLGFVSYAAADQSAALSKLDAAAAAAKDKKGADVKAALDAVGVMIADDTAAAGPVAKAIGGKERTSFADRAGAAETGNMPSEAAFGVMTQTVKDIYGLLIPGGKGDSAAAADYVKKVAAEATGDGKVRLEAAAEALGGGDKVKSFAAARVVVFGTYPILKAESLINEGKKDEAALLVNRVASYIGGEANLAREAKNIDAADILTEAAGTMKASAGDITKGRPVGLIDQMPDVEAAVTGSAPAVSAAPKAAEETKAPAEVKKGKKNQDKEAGASEK